MTEFCKHDISCIIAHFANAEFRARRWSMSWCRGHVNFPFAHLVRLGWLEMNEIGNIKVV